jgi:hypothetical protein
MTDPPLQVWTRYIAIDIHKHYLMTLGIDAHKRIVLQPRRVELHRWLDWAKANLHPTDAVVIEATSQDQSKRAMGQEKEALRAVIKTGPRAVLTGWGAEVVPEGGKKHELGVDDHPQPPAQAQAQWGHEVLPDRWMASRNETSRKLVRNCP